MTPLRASIDKATTLLRRVIKDAPPHRTQSLRSALQSLSNARTSGSVSQAKDAIKAAQAAIQGLLAIDTMANNAHT